MLPVPNLNVREVPKCKFASGEEVPMPSLLLIKPAPNEPVETDEPLILVTVVPKCTLSSSKVATVFSPLAPARALFALI